MAGWRARKSHNNEGLWNLIYALEGCLCILKNCICWRLYCERSFRPLPTLPMFQPGLYSSIVKRGGRPATESFHGFGGIVRTRNSRNGGLTSTANAVGNRLANCVKPSFGGPRYSPFSISLKANVIRLDVATTCVKSEFGFLNSTSNSCSVVLLANVLLKC